MGLSVNDALDAIDRAKSIPEVRDAVRQVAADPENADVILYTGVTEYAKRKAQEELGFSVIDDTDRAAVLMSDRFLTKLGQLAGMQSSPAEIAEALSGRSKLPDGHPDAPVVAHVQEMLFGKTGDRDSLQDSFWGEASRDFVNAAGGDVALLLGRDAPRVFWGVELPALVANPGDRKINGVPVSSLPSDPQQAYDAIKQSGQSEAKKYAPPVEAGAGKTQAPATGGGGGPPAARIGDPHVCPMVTVLVPHVGGPIVTGYPTVLIGGQPAARVGDMVTCVGPPDAIAMGSATVIIGGMMQARMGDPTIHGGSIVMGFPPVLIGG
jgi:uncharacterized Zn-binding protein involved in type VI secretion